MQKFEKVEILQKLKEFPIVPVFYHADITYTQNILQACYESGLRVFEYTNRGENAQEVFKTLSAFAKIHCPEMALGIGTIYHALDAQRFIDIGADFIVQPITNVEVAEVCEQYYLPWIPGALTLNEIYQARQWGADMVKVFPGSALGANYIKAIKAPMPDVSIMVTGGVEPTENSLREWFGAGATCVGIGSQLFAQNDATDFETLKNNLATLLQFAQSLIHSPKL